MTLIFLQYVLPALTGYGLFLLISGRFQPFRKPKLLVARPNWLLGLWFGFSVALVALLTMQVVNPLASNEVKTMLPASTAMLALMLLPGFPVYVWYRSLLQNQQSKEWQNTLEQNDFSLDKFDYLALPKEPVFDPDTNVPHSEESIAADSRYELDQTLIAHANQVPSDESYDAAFEREYDRLIKVSAVAVETELESTDKYNNAFQSSFAPAAAMVHGDLPQQQSMHNTTTTIEQPFHHPTESKAYNLAFDQWHDQFAANQNPVRTLVTDTDEFNDAFSEYRQNSVKAIELASLIDVELQQNPLESSTIQEVKASELESARIEVLIATELLTRERELKAVFDQIARRAIRAKETEANAVISEVRKDARTENRNRLETEKHLRITRRALSRLESETRSTESSKSDELIELELEFEERIKIAAKAESALLREEKLRSNLEHELLQSKQAVLAARRDARKNTAARAKVLTTANKAIEFARHTVDARSKVEADLEKLKEQIQVHQATISSLIDRLDHEKSKSREEVSFLSKQLMQKEIELEKKSIGAGNLTSRLVKKVARAKTVAG